jgi:aryl-alcohol dehydrogenase-like predicted oxidoreductase
VQYKELGETQLKVSCLGLGTMTFGGQVDVATAQRIVDECVEVGINFFDTADVYQDGRSEEVLGKCIAKHRSNVILATKVGMGPNLTLKGLSHRQIIEAVELSLKRLGTEYIDLYQVHRPDYSIDLEETLRALDELVKQGKVRYIGCSNYLAWYLCKALWVTDAYGLTQFSTTQARYNLLDRRIEDDLLKLCSKKKLGVITYNPLAGGFLTGKYGRGKDPSPGTMLENNSSYRERYWFHENFDAVETFLELTKLLGRDPVHLALRWVMNNPIVTVPIVGISSIDQLKHALPVLAMDISQEELDQCNTVLGVAFDRYAPWLSTNPRNLTTPS